MVSRRTQLLLWIEAGKIAPEHIPEALEVTGVMPDGRRWRRFIDQLMLLLGALSLVSAAVFFVAYNWDGMGHFGRFALIEALLALAVLSWWWLGGEALTAKVALFSAALMLGALLALFGQTYQTGADNWQLFAYWALLVLPWVLVSRFAAMWLLWLVLLNLAAMLYFQIFQGLLWTTFSSGDDLPWLLLLLNSIAWILWEFAAHRFEWLASRWAVRLIAIASGTAMTLLVLLAIFEPGNRPLLVWLVFAGWLGAVYAVYRRRSPDLFMLAGACLALIVCLTSLLVHVLLNGRDFAGSFLLLAFVVVVQAAAAAVWLKRVHAEQSS